MVEAIVCRLKGGLQLGKIHDPPGMGIDFTGDLQTHHKGVAMQATAFVSFRDVRQVVGGFEGEIFKQRGGHH